MRRIFLTILISIVLVSAMFGIALGREELIDRIVAVVGNEIILRSELDYVVALETQRQQLDSANNRQKIADVRTSILKGMIDDKILLAMAQEDSIEVDEREVEEYLKRQLSEIKRSAGEAEYREELKRRDLTEPEFRRSLRKEIRTTLLKEKEMAKLTESISVSPRDVARFREIYADSLPPNISISHIMIKPKPSEERLQSAYEKMGSIMERIEAGEDFAELAKTYSDDPGSAPEGGDLGFFGRGAITPEFEEAAFGLEPGQMSGIVRTDLGYHIIKVEEKRDEQIRVRHILMMVKMTEEDEEEAIQKLNEIRRRALEGEDFEALAKQFSEDEGSAAHGGFLGLYQRDDSRISLFQDALSRVKLGGVSLPFKTEFGIHILRVDDDPGLMEDLARQVKMIKELNRLLEDKKRRIYLDVRLEG